MDRAARDRASARPHHLSGRRAVRRHRLSALHLYDGRARNRPVDLLPPPRAAGGLADDGAAFRGKRRMIAERKVPMLPTLTGLRGIAALAVLFYHIRFAMAGFLPESAIALLAHGYLRSEEHTSELQSLMRNSYS